MWLTPWRSSTSSVRSATSWLARPRAAAPKRVRLLVCPVRPKASTGIATSARVSPFLAAVSIWLTPWRSSASSAEPAGGSGHRAARAEPAHRGGRDSPGAARPPAGRLRALATRHDPRHLPVSYTHLRAHETRHDLVCRLLLEKK